MKIYLILKMFLVIFWMSKGFKSQRSFMHRINEDISYIR